MGTAINVIGHERVTTAEKTFKITNIFHRINPMVLLLARALRFSSINNTIESQEWPTQVCSCKRGLEFCRISIAQPPPHTCVSMSTCHIHTCACWWRWRFSLWPGSRQAFLSSFLNLGLNLGPGNVDSLQIIESTSSLVFKGLNRHSRSSITSRL